MDRAISDTPSLLISEVQRILAEKRISLAALRASFVQRSVFRIRHYHGLIHHLERKSSLVSQFLE
jgi:hypothetical protein